MSSVNIKKREPDSANPVSKKPAGIQKYSVFPWIEANKSSFLPPVCNKMMYNEQLKVMFIGGPNIRKDFHLEEGEEWFYQLKGDMVLKVVEKGQHKDIPIKEGECFRLPPRIPHSPQRFENTVGLVIERERSKQETDGLRYYVDGSTDILWEEWFYCYDLGAQLGPVIKKFFASDEYKAGQPPPGKVFNPPPFELDTKTEVEVPFSFKEWVASHKEEIEKEGKKELIQSGEFKIAVWSDGEHSDCCEQDVFLWQLSGESVLTCSSGGGASTTLKEDMCFVVTAGDKFSAVGHSKDSRRLSVKMVPGTLQP